MSDPRKTYEDSIQGAMIEIVSAESALNMDPDPLKEPEGRYLSQRDGWAKHAMEHLRAAFEQLRHAHTEAERLKLKVFRLEQSIASQQKLIGELAHVEKCKSPGCKGIIDLKVCNTCRSY